MRINDNHTPYEREMLIPFDGFEETTLSNVDTLSILFFRYNQYNGYAHTD